MISHSPSVVHDGLVFAYDMANTKKSWKGKPTTNLYADGDFSSDVLHPIKTAAWMIVADPRHPSKKVLRANPAGSNQYHGRDIPAVVSTVYSLQMEVYVSDDFNGTNVQMYPEQGGSGAAVAYNLSNKGTWQTLIYNGKSATTTNIRMLAYVLSSFTTGYVLFSNVQVEQSTFATPFVNGTRSNTEAIVDLTGNNTVTVSSLTYNSDGTISFGIGGTNSFSIPTIDLSTEQTVEIWLKPEENDAVRRNPYNQAYGGYGTWTHEVNGSIAYYYGTSGGNAVPYTAQNSGFTVAQNELACVCHTRNISTVSWYKNGVQSVTGSNVYGVLPTTAANIIFGSGYAGAYYGKIYAVRVYNRALTAAEVQQNFNATRSRYGI